MDGVNEGSHKSLTVIAWTVNLAFAYSTVELRYINCNLTYLFCGVGRDVHAQKISAVRA